MSLRDRIVVMVLAVLALAAGGYLMLVKPERKEASRYAAEVTTAESQLSSAQSKLADAQQAQSQYASAYASVVNLGKAVPASQEVASLVYELEQVSNQHNVQFNSIASSDTGTSSSSAAPAPTAGAASAASAGFTEMPFTFVFDGGFFELERLFRGLTSFTTHGSGNSLEVSGRLLSIQSVKLAPESSDGAKPGSTPKLSGTVTATAYVLPAGQSLTGGATATSPTGATTPASGSASSSSTAPAAVAKVVP